MPNRCFERGQLQFITTSTYHRVRLFTSERFCWTFVEALRHVRANTGALLLGWVLMPDHFHILVKCEPPEATIRFMQDLKRRAAQEIIAMLLRNYRNPRCNALLARLQLSPTVQNDCYYRLWERRYVPFNVYSEKKHLQKLDCMHDNPVAARLAASPDRWPWSSFRFYYLNDSSVLAMDRYR